MGRRVKRDGVLSATAAGAEEGGSGGGSGRDRVARPAHGNEHEPGAARTVLGRCAIWSGITGERSDCVRLGVQTEALAGLTKHTQVVSLDAGPWPHREVARNGRQHVPLAGPDLFGGPLPG
jgi:hypothetical protein